MATHLLVTADHGFLFQETPPGETDKNSLASKPEGTVMAKKRYLLGPQPARQRQGLSWLHGSDGRCRRRDGVLGAQGGQPLPLRGRRALRARRRHAAGGRGAGDPRASGQGTSKAAKTKTRTVGVSVLGSNFKVTTNRHRFQLIQTEPVSERVKPITLKVAIYEGE